MTTEPPPYLGNEAFESDFLRHSARVPRAGFWIRFGAVFIDGVLLTVVTLILESALRATGDLLGVLLSVGYFTYFEGQTGQTLGKLAVGIKVVDIDAGEPIGYSRAAVRWLGRIVSAIVIYLGYFWMLWDQEKQCWHDKMARDVVVAAVR